MRPSTETLRASDEVHQIRIARRADLRCFPGKIMESLVVAARIGIICERAALAPFAALYALNDRLSLQERREDEESGEYQWHTVPPARRKGWGRIVSQTIPTTSNPPTEHK